MQQAKNFGLGLALQIFFFFAAKSLLTGGYEQIWFPLQVAFFLLWSFPLYRAITGVGAGGGRVTGYPAAHAKWLRGTRRRWNRDMDTSGLVVKVPNKKNPGAPRVLMPRLVHHRPVPVGIELILTPVGGRQTTSDLLAAKGRLESLWRVPLRMVASGPASVTATVLFTSPLEETRAAGDDWMGPRGD